MTDDQAFIIGLLTILVPTATATLGLLQGRQTHKIVNGLQQRKVRAAHTRGVREGVHAAVDAPEPPPV